MTAVAKPRPRTASLVKGAGIGKTKTRLVPSARTGGKIKSRTASKPVAKTTAAKTAPPAKRTVAKSAPGKKVVGKASKPLARKTPSKPVARTTAKPVGKAAPGKKVVARTAKAAPGKKVVAKTAPSKVVGKKASPRRKSGAQVAKSALHVLNMQKNRLSKAIESMQKDEARLDEAIAKFTKETAE